MKMNISLKGKIAIGIIILYIVMALIVPFLPLRDPMAYKAPPSDIFAPQIVDNYTFKQKIVSIGTYETTFYIITEDYKFIVYDIHSHSVKVEHNLSEGQYSDINMLLIYPGDYPIFHNKNMVYVYHPALDKLIEYPVENISQIYILNEPFNAFSGFIVLNSTGFYAFSFSPYFPHYSPPLWKINIEEKPLGIHYSYKHIFISTPHHLINVNSDGEIKWIVNGNFTSNPIFLPIYGNQKLYVASENNIQVYSTSNGTLIENIEMPSSALPISRLEYRGQALYAYSSKGVFGKVNLLKNGFSWKIENIKDYTMSPFIDGMGVIFKDGKIGFVLIADGTIQWGQEEDVYRILIGEITHTPCLFSVASNQTLVSQYSYSGKMIAPLPPNEKYVLGTDAAGRDVFSQLLWGFREEIYIALLSGAAVLLIGTLWGLISGYFSGLIDDALLLLSDSFLFIPAIGYAALMIYLFGVTHHIEATIGAAILALAPLEARAVRNYTKVVKEKAFIESAKVAGASHWRIIFIHILPEIKGISLVYTISATTMALLLEVGISFLGFGNYTIPTWGWMITNAYFTGYWDRWWLMGPPIIALWLLVYSLYLISQELYTTEYILPLKVELLLLRRVANPSKISI